MSKVVDINKNTANNVKTKKNAYIFCTEFTNAYIKIMIENKPYEK